jgi:polar amino acid transport system substrate-binding protein
MKKNKLNMVCASALISAGLFLSGCTKPADSAATPGAASAPGGAASVAQAAESARNYVVVGVDAQSVPMVFWDTKTNVLTGYDIDLAKEAFKRAGLKYEFQAILWEEKEQHLLEEKQIDAIWSSLTITDARKKIFAFSSPYMKNKQAILVRADSTIQNKKDLKGKIVAVQKGSTGSDLVKKIKIDAPAKVEEFEQKVEPFSAVLSGKADAAVTDSVTLEYYATQSPGKFRVLNENLQEEEFGVAVRPADTELLAKINKALAEMQADGTAQAIHQRWFGESK